MNTQFETDINTVYTQDIRVNVASAAVLCMMHTSEDLLHIDKDSQGLSGQTTCNTVVPVIATDDAKIQNNANAVNARGRQHIRCITHAIDLQFRKQFHETGLTGKRAL